MLRSLLRVGAAIALAGLIAPAAPSAEPAPGLAYDEVVRVVVDASPPPPGSFASDVAAARAQPPSAPVPAPTPAARRGIGGAIAGVLRPASAAPAAGDEAATAAERALQTSLGASFADLAASARPYLEPHLLRYAFWNGWERIDDETARQATIWKCDAGTVIRLNLATKTYAVEDPAAATASRAQTGTGEATLSETTRALAPLQLAGGPAHGYATATTYAVRGATGSCRDGTASIDAVQYVAEQPRPTVNACPTVRAPLPASASEAVSEWGGCRPAFVVTRSGPTPPSNRLVVYALVRFGGGASLLTERGDLQPLGASDAARFAAPPDFARVP